MFCVRISCVDHKAGKVQIMNVMHFRNRICCMIKLPNKVTVAQGRSQEYEEGGAGLYARIARGENFWTTPTIFDHAY